MSRSLYINLPVSDPIASVPFYEALGGKLSADLTGDDARCVNLAANIGVMLLSRQRYSTFTSRPIGNPLELSFALPALSAGSKSEVDSLVEAAGAAGGRADPNPPQDHGFYYGRSVEDPDGFVLEIYWMEPGSGKE